MIFDAPKSAGWVFREGIRVFGMWEPLYFERMRGNCGDNQRLLYDFKRGRTFLKHLAKQGYNQVWFNWWKGYGLNHERECQEQVARLFPVCRELGLRAVCYHSFGSLTLDTLLAEEPDAVNWIARTQSGQPTSCQVTYQCFRHRPCFSSEGYLACMEKVLARAIDAGAAGVYDRYYRIRRQRLARIATMGHYAKAQRPLNAFHELIGPDPLGSGEDAILRRCGKGRVAWLRALDVDRQPHTPEHRTIGAEWLIVRF